MIGESTLLLAAKRIAAVHSPLYTFPEETQIKVQPLFIHVTKLSVTSENMYPYR